MWQKENIGSLQDKVQESGAKAIKQWANSQQQESN